MDGMTFGAKVDTNNGHFELTSDVPTYDEFPAPPNGNGSKSFNLMDSFDKKELSKKFTQLSNFS